jgi:hypothetical protein
MADVESRPTAMTILLSLVGFAAEAQGGSRTDVSSAALGR